MADEDDPTISVHYYTTTWHDITSDVYEFDANNGDIFIGGSAKVKLNNIDGKYTSGSGKIPPYSYIRIRGDVRGTQDLIFLGRFQRYEGDYKNVNDDIVTLHCTGPDFKLDCHAITYNYLEKYPRGTYKDVIEHMLAYPDSYIDTGLGTGITFTTDSGNILNSHNLEELNQRYIGEVIRDICERINYTGRMESESSLVLKAVGTEPSNPAVTLADPFVYVKPDYNIRELRNYVMPWGGIELGIPMDDRCTERALYHYPGSWIATDPTECQITDSQTHVYNGNWAIRIMKYEGENAMADARCRFNIIYPSPGYIDLTETLAGGNYRFTDLMLAVYPSAVADSVCVIELVDINDTRICSRAHYLSLYKTGAVPMNTWTTLSVPVNPDTWIHGPPTAEWASFLFGGWWYVSGSSFNWKVKEARIFYTTIDTYQYSLYVDSLMFRGAKNVEPTLYTNLIKKDQSSITSYGHRMLPIRDSQMSSSSNAEALAQYNLDVFNTPIEKLEAKKGAKIWVKPAQTVTAIVPHYEVSGTWRVVNNKIEWKKKILRTTFSIVPQYDPVSRRTFKSDELSGLLMNVEVKR